MVATCVASELLRLDLTYGEEIRDMAWHTTLQAPGLLCSKVGASSFMRTRFLFSVLLQVRTPMLLTIQPLQCKAGGFVFTAGCRECASINDVTGVAGCGPLDAPPGR